MTLSFDPYVQQLVRKWKVNLGFYFRVKSCLSFEAKKKLVAATFMSVLDYGDDIYARIFSEFTCYRLCLSWCTEVYNKS